VRASPLVVTLALIGLFVVSLVLGYAIGEIFLKQPGIAQQPAAVPSPMLPAPAAVPSPSQPPLAVTAPTPPPPAVSPTPLPTPASTPVPTVAVAKTPAPRPTVTQAAGATLFRVQAGAFLKRENAQERVNQLRAAGFDAYLLPSGELFKVFVGAFAERENAERLAERLRAVGFETIIVRQ